MMEERTQAEELEQAIRDSVARISISGNTVIFHCDDKSTVKIQGHEKATFSDMKMSPANELLDGYLK